MFTFNITMEQLLRIRKDHIEISGRPNEDADTLVAFDTKNLHFFEYMQGWEYEDLTPYSVTFHEPDTDSVIGKIVSLIGETMPETEEERQKLEDMEEAMDIIHYQDKNHIALTMESGTNWDHNKTGSFLSHHAPFYIRPYEGDKMEIVDSNGNWLLRTTKVIKGGDYDNYSYIVTENGHKYQFVTVESC